VPSSKIPSEKAFLGIAPSRKVLRRGSNPTAAPTNSKRTWLGDIAMALLNSPLGKAVWTTQAKAVAAPTEGALTAGLSVAADARRFHALSIASQVHGRPS
jgi:hypothetical protein